MSFGPKPKPIAERLMSKILKHAGGGCWQWMGCVGPKGYGRIRVGGKTKLAHRVAFENFTGKSIGSMDLDHLCRNPTCVNPDHLEPVTRAENTRRGIAGGIARHRQLQKTHCPRGHEYSIENTYISPRGHRNCKTCRRISSMNSRSRVNGK